MGPKKFRFMNTSGDERVKFVNRGSTVYQYSETNVMQFLLNLLRIKGRTPLQSWCSQLT
jgi:hypothetical protein